ncbi:TlpA family protein disulfide reductase [Psychroflexus salinarum]|uniref:TlpA family protein disulfide reductase n=1 Tax=Psychroflexus salinarum TaxID=546024 RepID=A0ABW3GTI2_9FLAO
MEIQLESLENEILSIHNLLKEGQINLILFYNTYCLGCTGRAIPFAYELTREFPEINLIVIHTNFGNQSFPKTEILDIFTTKASPFEIYIDPKAEAYNYFECEGTPHWIVLDQSLNQYRSIFGSQDQAQQRLWYAIESLRN